MGAISIPDRTMFLPRLRQRVWISGVLRSDCFCTSVAYGNGTAGVSAAFVVPSADWDSGKRELRGASIKVDVGYDGSGYSVVFLGFVDSTSGQIQGDSISFTARSILGFSDRVYIGQGVLPGGALVAEYPSSAYKNGIRTETGWRATAVLRDWFSDSPVSWRGGGGTLPASWRSKVVLGSLAPLREAFENLPLGDLSFRSATLMEALDQLLGLVGTLSVRESFLSNGKTRLDFFLVGDSSGPVKTVKVARRGESAVGTNVLDINHDESIEGVRTRLVAFGDRMKFVISIRSDHAFAPLRKGWDVDLEASVLENPECVKRGAESGDEEDETRQEYREALGLVFRRFLLPEWVRAYLVEKENALTLSDGSTVPVQLFKIPRIPRFEGGSWVSSLGATPVLLEGAQLDLENLAFTLKEPAINMVSGYVDAGGNIVDVYEPAVVGVTLTVSSKRISYDTGTRSGLMDLEGLEAAGLVESVTNDSFGFRQLCGTLNGFTYPATVLVGEVWESYSSPTILQDDRRVLRAFAEQALRESARIRAAYAVTTPFWTPAFGIGDCIRIVGQDDFDFGVHQILSLDFDLTADHQVSFSTDSQVPMVASDILKGEGGSS